MENETKESIGTVYEISYLFVPNIAEENLPAKVTAIKDLVTERGGVFISEDHPRFMELAYQMDRTIANKKEKFTKAYFGWIKFELSPDKIEEISKHTHFQEIIWERCSTTSTNRRRRSETSDKQGGSRCGDREDGKC